MKCSELIREIANTISYYGDIEVKLCVLTENDDLEIELKSINLDDCENSQGQKYLAIDLDTGCLTKKEMKALKKLIKEAEIE